MFVRATRKATRVKETPTNVTQTRAFTAPAQIKFLNIIVSVTLATQEPITKLKLTNVHRARVFMDAVLMK